MFNPSAWATFVVVSGLVVVGAFMAPIILPIVFVFFKILLGIFTGIA